MAIVSKPFTFTPGTVILSAQVNSDFDTLYNDYNGNITNANISGAAAIACSKLATIDCAGKVDFAAFSIAGQAQGDLIYRNATVWTRLPAGTSGQVLQTGGPAANPAWATITPVTSGFLNLAVTRPSVTTVTVTADELTVSPGVKITSVSETANITVSGAGGLDTGAEAANTWYYIWIIRKSSDGTVDALLSLSSTAPTMPAGYDQKALVSAVHNDSASDFVNFIQRGTIYSNLVWRVMASGNVGSTPWVSITTTNFVPSGLSTHSFGSLISFSAVFSAITNDSTVADSSTPDRNKISSNVSAGGIIQDWNFELLTANTLYWVSANAADTVYCAGFYINKLS